MRIMEVILQSLSFCESIQRSALPADQPVPFGSWREVCADPWPCHSQQLTPCSSTSAGGGAGLDDSGVGTADATWAELSTEDPRLALCADAEEDELTGTLITCWAATCCLMSFAGPVMGTRGIPNQQTISQNVLHRRT